MKIQYPSWTTSQSGQEIPLIITIALAIAYTWALDCLCDNGYLIVDVFYFFIFTFYITFCDLLHKAFFKKNMDLIKNQHLKWLFIFHLLLTK